MRGVSKDVIFEVFWGRESQNIKVGSRVATKMIPDLWGESEFWYWRIWEGKEGAEKDELQKKEGGGGRCGVRRRRGHTLDWTDFCETSDLSGGTRDTKWE